MSKHLRTTLALGLLSMSTLSAAGVGWEEINLTTPPRPLEAPTTSAAASVSMLTQQAAAELKLFRTQSLIRDMDTKERKDLVNRLSVKRMELETAIPTERQAAAAAESCCFLFWKSCFRISAKTLGSLAIDLIMDISDGKLDGHGPDGSIDYIHHVVSIVNATIEEAKTVAER
jgi:hypothetical protein